MKIIFLDFDGVLNSHNWYKVRSTFVDGHSIQAQYPFYEIDPSAITNLNRIISETGAKVVVSSTWRLGRTPTQLMDILKPCGFVGEIIDCTPHMRFLKGYDDSVPRGCEIKGWLSAKGFSRTPWSKQQQLEVIEKSQVKNYVILDDDIDMLYCQTEHFVNTSEFTGLTEEYAAKCIDILNTSILDLYFKNNITNES